MTSPALVAVAHGSRDPAAARATEALLQEVRRQRPGLDVTAAYLDHAEPSLRAAVAALTGRAVVVPLLLTAAYHSRVDIPAQLTDAPVPVGQADALGPHPLLLAGLERRLTEVQVAAGDPGTAVVLASAGSADTAAASTAAALAAAWERRGWWAVRAAFASAARPTVGEAVAELRARGAPRVAIASYLLFPGLFSDRMREAGADDVAASLAAAPEVAAVVLERYDEAAGRVRAGGTRASADREGGPSLRGTAAPTARRS